MISSFFDRRGDIYFYNPGIIDPFFNDIIAGNYTIVQRHNYGALSVPVNHRCPASTRFSCLYCPYQQSCDHPTPVVQSYLPSENRLVILPESEQFRNSRGIMTFDGKTRTIKHINPYNTQINIPPRTDNAEIYVQAGAEMSNSGRAKKDKNRREQPNDEVMRRIIEGEGALQQDGSTIKFGFVVNTEKMREREREGNWKHPVGFQFLQMELVVKKPTDDDLEDNPSYSRQVIVAVKTPLEADGVRMTSSMTLDQELDPMIVIWLETEEDSLDMGLIFKCRYEPARSTVAPTPSSSEIAAPPNSSPNHALGEGLSGGVFDGAISDIASIAATLSRSLPDFSIRSLTTTEWFAQAFATAGIHADEFHAGEFEEWLARQPPNFAQLSARSLRDALDESNHRLMTSAEYASGTEELRGAVQGVGMILEDAISYVGSRVRDLGLL